MARVGRPVHDPGAERREQARREGPSLEEGDDEEQARDLHGEGGTDRCRGAPGEVQREVLWVQAAEGEQGKGAKEHRVHEVVDARGRARARELGAVRPETGQPEG